MGKNQYAKISCCYAVGTVHGSLSTGGALGENAYGMVSDCYAKGSTLGTGSDTGGFVGSNIGTISRCYATGTVSGIINTGGLAGSNYGTISASFWDTETSAQPSSAGGEGKTTVEMQKESTFRDAGWDFIETWGIEDNQTYPFLKLTYPIGDLNHDKVVNFLDFAILAEHWLEGI